MDRQHAARIGIGVAWQRGGEEALAAAAIDRAGIGVGRAVERDPHLAAAPMHAAGRDDPGFEIAGGEAGRRLEQDRRVGVAGEDKRIERGAGGGLLWVKGRRADAERVYRSWHRRT